PKIPPRLRGGWSGGPGGVRLVLSLPSFGQGSRAVAAQKSLPVFREGGPEDRVGFAWPCPSPVSGRGPERSLPKNPSPASGRVVRRTGWGVPALARRRAPSQDGA